MCSLANKANKRPHVIIRWRKFKICDVIICYAFVFRNKWQFFYGKYYLLLLSLQIKSISILYRPLTSQHSLFTSPWLSNNLTFSSAVLRRLSLTMPVEICRCCSALRNRSNPVAFHISHSPVFASINNMFHWALLFIIILKKCSCVIILFSSWKVFRCSVTIVAQFENTRNNWLACVFAMSAVLQFLLIHNSKFSLTAMFSRLLAVAATTNGYLV